MKRGKYLGINERKSKETEIRKNDIIDAAERVFFEKGYERATMDDVAGQAEFSKRTLYAYFESKEQIYFEIMIRGYRRLIGLLEERLARRFDGAREELREIAATYYEFSGTHPHYFRAIVEYENSVDDFQNKIPDASRDQCYALGEKALGFVKAALKRGVGEKAFRSDLAIDRTTMTLWACMLGIFGTAQKKKGYIENFYGIDTESFIRDGCLLLIRALEP